MYFLKANRGRNEVKGKDPAAAGGDDALKAQLEEKLTLLDAQISRFKRENEACRVGLFIGLLMMPCLLI